MPITVLELAYIIAWRGEPCPSQARATRADLETLAGPVAPQEAAAAEDWLAAATASHDVEMWKNADGSYPSVQVLARALSSMSGHHMLVPPGIIAASTRAADPLYPQRLVIAYYKARGFPVTPMPSRLTVEQEAVAALGALSPEAPARRTVVGAGPGAGKTSAAVALARRAVLSGRRILFLAFANSALRTVASRLAADPYLGSKFERDAFSSEKGKRFHEKPILLSTVDKVAGYINVGRADRAVRGNTMKSFEERVREALSKLQNDPGAIEVFLEGGQVPMFDHVVLDEGQMMSEERAALARALAKGMSYESLNRGRRSCHMTVMCDPRQSIEGRAGPWLREIFEGGPGAVCDGMAWDIMNLTLSFRFEADLMLEHVMRVSRGMGALHVEMQGALPMAPAEVTGPVVTAMQVSDIEGACARMEELYWQSRSVAVLSPTIGRSNAVSRQADAVALELRRRGVPVCLQGEGNFYPHGVNIITYHTSAGMEFAHVFLLGASGYPGNYREITPEVGHSLVFVANSRAKRTLTYLLDGGELCVGVDKAWVVPLFDPCVATLESYALPERYEAQLPEAWTAEKVFPEGGGGTTFMAANGFKLGHYVKGEGGVGRGAVSLYDLHAAWGRPACLVGAAPGGGASTGSGLAPNAAHARGRASAGKVCGDSKGRPRWEMRGAPEGSSDREAFYWYMNARPEPESREGAELGGRIKLLAERVLEGALGAEVTFSPVSPYSRVTREGDEFCLAPEYMFVAGACAPGVVPAVGARSGFVVIGRDPMRALFPSAVVWATRGTSVPVLHVDASGRVALYDGFQSRVGRLLAPLVRLHVYCAKTVFRDNYMGVPVERRPAVNTFAVDTEYVEGKEIYELGVLNLANPYASLSLLLRCKSGVPAERLADMGLTERDYGELAVSAVDAQALFMCGLVDPSGPPPKLLYFSASQDLGWAADLVRAGPGGRAAVGAEDVAAAAARVCPKRGVYGSDSTAVNLDTLYGMYVGPQHYGEGMRHRAFPDALMLGEIVCGMLQAR